MGKLQRPHICLICQFIGFIDAVYLHIFEVHLHKSPPMKCGCGIVRATGKGMQRHQNKSMCHGPFLPADHGVSLETYMKPASQLETLKNARGKAKVVDHLEMRPDILDFNDWMLLNESTKLTSEQSCQTDLCEAENSILESLTKENEKLKEEIRNLKRINESLSNELMEPDMGLPNESALYGFNDCWRQCQNEMSPGPLLFPEPPKKVQSQVTVPERNTNLSRNQKLWKRSMEDAKTNYNKRHKR